MSEIGAFIKMLTINLFCISKYFTPSFFGQVFSFYFCSMKSASDRSYKYIYFIDGEMKLRMVNDLMSQLNKDLG